MPTLTRRRYPERPDCWHIYCGDIHAGTIARRVGIRLTNIRGAGAVASTRAAIPASAPSARRRHTNRPRAGFEQAWRTEADFREWRETHAWSPWKYAMFDKGCRMPTQWLLNSRFGCTDNN
jgi:hypothetical protein